MVEFKIPKIIMANLKGDVKVVTLEELMPYAFTEF
jgi:cytidine deaminase